MPISSNFLQMCTQKMPDTPQIHAIHERSNTRCLKFLQLTPAQDPSIVLDRNIFGPSTTRPLWVLPVGTLVELSKRPCLLMSVFIQNECSHELHIKMKSQGRLKLKLEQVLMGHRSSSCRRDKGSKALAANSSIICPLSRLLQHKVLM